VGGEAEDEDQVDWPIAHDLIGDRGVAGLGVSGLRGAQRNPEPNRIPGLSGTGGSSGKSFNRNGRANRKGHNSLVADRQGKTAAFALFGLQERGTLFIGPGEDVYEGMIVGENSRAEDIDVNAIKEKQQTNVRAAAADQLIKLVPAKRLSLEEAI
jgi:hypothetical protein